MDDDMLDYMSFGAGDEEYMWIDQQPLPQLPEYTDDGNNGDSGDNNANGNNDGNNGGNNNGDVNNGGEKDKATAIKKKGIRSNVLTGSGRTGYRYITDPKECHMYGHIEVAEFVAVKNLFKCVLSMNDLTKEFKNEMKVLHKGDHVTIICSPIYKSYVKTIDPEGVDVQLPRPIKRIQKKRVKKAKTKECSEGVSKVNNDVKDSASGKSDATEVNKEEETAKEKEVKKETEVCINSESNRNKVNVVEEVRKGKKKEDEPIITIKKEDEPIITIKKEDYDGTNVENAKEKIKYDYDDDDDDDYDDDDDDYGDDVIKEKEKKRKKKEKDVVMADEIKVEKADDIKEVDGIDQTQLAEKKVDEPKKVVRNQKRFANETTEMSIARKNHEEENSVWILVQDAKGKNKLWRRRIDLVLTALSHRITRHIPVWFTQRGSTNEYPKLVHMDPGPLHECYRTELAPGCTLWIDELLCKNLKDIMTCSLEELTSDNFGEYQPIDGGVDWLY